MKAVDAEETTDETDAGDAGVEAALAQHAPDHGVLLKHRVCVTPAGEDDVEDVVEDAESKPPKKEKRSVWEVLNRARPLWLRPASDVSANEYKDFYKAISKVGVGTTLGGSAQK